MKHQEKTKLQIKRERNLKRIIQKCKHRRSITKEVIYPEKTKLQIEYEEKLKQLKESCKVLAKEDVMFAGNLITIILKERVIVQTFDIKDKDGKYSEYLKQNMSSVDFGKKYNRFIVKTQGCTFCGKEICKHDDEGKFNINEIRIKK